MRVGLLDSVPTAGEHGRLSVIPVDSFSERTGPTSSQLPPAIARTRLPSSCALPGRQFKASENGNRTRDQDGPRLSWLTIIASVLSRSAENH